MAQEALKVGDRVIWLFTPSSKHQKAKAIDAVVIKVTSSEWTRIEYSLPRDNINELMRRLVRTSTLSRHPDTNARNEGPGVAAE